MDQADWRRGPGFDSGLSWLLDDLVTRVAQVDKAVILSRDGLATRRLGQADPRGCRAPGRHGRRFPEPGAGHRAPFRRRRVRQTIVEMENSFLFVTAAGEGSCLAVLSPASADAGLIAYEMALLVKRVGQHLSVTPRPVPAGARRIEAGDAFGRGPLAR